MNLKRKGPEIPPSDDGTTLASAKRSKTHEPSGLVSNWKQNVQLLSQHARKHPVQFNDDEDDLAEGEFDQAEGLDTLNAIRASKSSSVRISKPLEETVCDLIVTNRRTLIYYLQLHT
jgi:hypothetical protein